MLNVHRFLGPNFASVRTAVSCGWIASDDAHGHVVFPSRLQARIVAVMSKRLACVISARTPIARSREPLKPVKPSSAARRRGPLSQRWLTFLRNHAPNIADRDMFVVPTIGLDLLYVLVIVRLGRRQLVWINVTPSRTAEWIRTPDHGGIPRYLIVIEIRPAALW